ncbi:hypothetical protein OG440_38780 (plasmid) [Streptomyces sp. NBC_00637]|uniref:hypothetical protein n=1 Tax=Streptomyces sp. NBC_00637 TaxID=2903667 RepID=UPI003247163F
MPSTVELVLQAATPEQEPTVREVLRAARLLWQCRRHPCGHDNPQSTRLCELCGRQRNGRRIADIVPFSADDDAFEALREALKEHFAGTGQPRPDAVTFDMNVEKEWRASPCTSDPLKENSADEHDPHGKSHDTGRELPPAAVDAGSPARSRPPAPRRHRSSLPCRLGPPLLDRARPCRQRE